jgi:maleate isomerase
MDIYGYRGKIGIVLPSTNTVVEPEAFMVQPVGVTTHVSRIEVRERPLTSEQAFLEHVEAMRAGIAGAIDLVMTCRPNHIIMAVALEAFWGGYEAAQKLEADLAAQAGVPVSLGSNATLTALQAFGARRIAVITPHQPRGDEMVRLYFEQAGLEVVRLIGLKRGSALQIATTTAAEMRAALVELDGPDVEAIVQVGTNLPMKGLAAALEEWLDKPVLSINTVTYWDALRRMGIADRTPGHGRILEQF